MNRTTVLLAVLVLCVGGICPADDAKKTSGGLIAPEPLGEIQDGREVQIKVRDKYLGDDLAGRGTLFRLTNKHGNIRDRIMNRYVKDYSGSKKYLIRIVTPADIRKIGLLTWENKGRDDTRFLYVPALKKTRRIATKDRGGRFIGSDFNYEDLGTIPVDDYTYSKTKTVMLDGRECYYYECYAKPGSGAVYKKMNTWTCKKTSTRIRIEHFDRHDRLWKVFTSEDFKLLPADNKGVWTPHHLTMKNVQDGHQTEFFMKGITYNNRLHDDLFSQVNLEMLSSEDLNTTLLQ